MSGDLFQTWERPEGAPCHKTTVEKRSPVQPATYADIDDLPRDVGFVPATPIKEGIARCVQWYREFYRV